MDEERDIQAMQDHYEKQIEDLQGALQLSNWKVEALEQGLEDPEFQRRLRVFEQVALAMVQRTYLTLQHDSSLREPGINGAKPLLPLMNPGTLEYITNTAEAILNESSKFSVRKEGE